MQKPTKRRRILYGQAMRYKRDGPAPPQPTIPEPERSTILERTVLASLDDARYEYDDNGGGPSWSSGGSPVAFGKEWDVDHDVYWDNWSRFLDVTIPQGATIVSAIVRMYSVSAQSTQILNRRIYAQDEDDAHRIVDEVDYDGITWTGAYASWDDVEAFPNNTWIDSPDFTSVIQEIVDRELWASGNAIGITNMEHNSEVGVGVAKRYLSTVDGGAGLGWHLLVEYEG